MFINIEGWGKLPSVYLWRKKKKRGFCRTNKIKRSNPTITQERRNRKQELQLTPQRNKHRKWGQQQRDLRSWPFCLSAACTLIRWRCVCFPYSLCWARSPRTRSARTRRGSWAAGARLWIWPFLWETDSHRHRTWTFPRLYRALQRTG